MEEDETQIYERGPLKSIQLIEHLERRNKISYTPRFDECYNKLLVSRSLLGLCVFVQEKLYKTSMEYRRIISYERMMIPVLERAHSCLVDIDIEDQLISARLMTKHFEILVVRDFGKGDYTLICEQYVADVVQRRLLLTLLGKTEDVSSDESAVNSSDMEVTTDEPQDDYMDKGPEYVSSDEIDLEQEGVKVDQEEVEQEKFVKEFVPMDESPDEADESSSISSDMSNVGIPVYFPDPFGTPEDCINVPTSVDPLGFRVPLPPGHTLPEDSLDQYLNLLKK